MGIASSHRNLSMTQSALHSDDVDSRLDQAGGKCVSIMPISALETACRVLDYAESGGVALLLFPFGAPFRTPLTN
jgi:hypothetical protein